MLRSETLHGLCAENAEVGTLARAVLCHHVRPSFVSLLRAGPLVPFLQLPAQHWGLAQLDTSCSLVLGKSSVGAVPTCLAETLGTGAVGEVGGGPVGRAGSVCRLP